MDCFDLNWACNKVEARRQSAVMMAVSGVLVSVSWWLWPGKVSSPWTEVIRRYVLVGP
jgi:hypothetical protein